MYIRRIVSVPLSGLSFLIKVQFNCIKKQEHRFRPLIGVIISNPDSNDVTTIQIDFVSVPLSGLSFLIRRVNSSKILTVRYRFRPLIGVIISNLLN